MSVQTEVNSQQIAKRVPRRRGLSVIPEFSVISRFEPGRTLAERYIAGKFARHYGATLTAFMPELLVMHTGAIVSGQADEISAAVGIRRGTDAAPLFLETYLDEPAETVLAKLINEPVRRESLAEIGNLVSTQAGGSQLLFVALTLLLCEQSLEWAIFTATPEVQKLLRRLHIGQFVLGEADGDRLGAAKQNWGSYYDCKPSVIAVSTLAARKALMRHPLSALMVAGCEDRIRQLCRFEA